MMNARSFVAVAASLLTGACSSAISAPQVVAPGGSVQLSANGVASVSRSNVKVQFREVNDSRCPSDVVCVQAGDAEIILNFSGAGAERTDSLYLVRTPRSVVYGGYRFEAVEVQPYPRTTEKAPAKTVVLKVTSAP